MNRSKIKELAEQIIPAFSAEQLQALPENEANEFMRYKLIPAELLVNASWNYKEDDETTDEKLGENIKRQGQTENINVRPLETGYFEVGNGNHRNNVFKAHGRNYVLCCDHGQHITQQEFMRRCIEQNETKYPVNAVQLSKILNEISDAIPIDELQMSMPYSSIEMEQMLNVSKHDWEQYLNKGGDEDPGDGYLRLSFHINGDLLSLWERLVEKIDRITGRENSNERIFEFAIVEALNLPDHSIQGITADEEE